MKTDRLKLLSRRSVIKHLALGTPVIAISFATGIPMPILDKIGESILNGAEITPIDMPWFIMFESYGGIRPNDFNITKEKQPELLRKFWSDDDYIQVSHGNGETLLYPPTFRPLSQFADRIAVLTGVLGVSGAHPVANVESCSNLIHRPNATTFHIAARKAMGGIISPSFIKTAPFEGGNPVATSRVSDFKQLLKPLGYSDQVMNQIKLFRDDFHKNIYRRLSIKNRKKVDLYLEADQGYTKLLEKAESFSGIGEADDLSSQCSLADLLHKTGLAHSFLISFDNGKNTDHHDKHWLHHGLIQESSEIIGKFFSKLADSGSLDQLTAVFSSAFGRNPTYNAQTGTDHLPTNNHYMLFGKHFKSGHYGLTRNTPGNAFLTDPYPIDFSTGKTAATPTPTEWTEMMTPLNVLHSVGRAIGLPKMYLDREYGEQSLIKFAIDESRMREEITDAI